MSNTSEKENSPQLIFRVYPEPSGKVLLLYEPLDQQVEVSPPINKENLEKAQELLVEKCAAVLKAQEEHLEGKTKTTPSPQEASRQLVKKIFEPQPRPAFWTYVGRVFARFFENLVAAFAVLMMISIVYKGVELSQDRLPEFAHWVVLAGYVIGLSFCVYLMANDEQRRKQTKTIRVWFGPSGMLVLPSLTLVAAAAVFSSITLSLYKHGLVMLQPCTGRAVAAGSLTDFYMWHFIKLVPLVKINEVLKLGEPLCYTQRRVGLLILLFQALVVIPSINTVLYYWKNRNTPKARAYNYVYEPEWEPSEKRLIEIRVSKTTSGQLVDRSSPTFMAHMGLSATPHQRQFGDCSSSTYQSNPLKPQRFARRVSEFSRIRIVLHTQRQIRRMVVCRLDLNYPLTAVSGIRVSAGSSLLVAWT